MVTAGGPNAILAHSYSSLNIQARYINGREVGEIGLDALIAAEHKVPVVMVQGLMMLVERLVSGFRVW